MMELNLDIDKNVEKECFLSLSHTILYYVLFVREQVAQHIHVLRREADVVRKEADLPKTSKEKARARLKEKEKQKIIAYLKQLDNITERLDKAVLSCPGSVQEILFLFGCNINLPKEQYRIIAPCYKETDQVASLMQLKRKLLSSLSSSEYGEFSSKRLCPSVLHVLLRIRSPDDHVSSTLQTHSFYRNAEYRAMDTPRSVVVHVNGRPNERRLDDQWFYLDETVRGLGCRVLR